MSTACDTTTIALDLVAEIEAPATSSDGFGISFIDADSDPRVEAAVATAAERWGRVIVGDLTDQALDIAAGTCGVAHRAISETVDDLALIVRVAPLDGPGGALASAGPCVLRPSNRLPVLGSVVIDAADLEDLVTREALDATLIHEIGHVLGLGSLWVGLGQTSGVGSADPIHVGASTVAQFQALGGDGAGVPLENLGATGTRDVHWRESVLRAEVMTGWLTPGALNPLSRVTIGALEDLGYHVDYEGADTFSTTSAPQRSQLFTVELAIRERQMPAPIVLRR